MEKKALSRQVERAVDALSRGWPVGISGHKDTVQAAEAMVIEAPLPQVRAVLSGGRGRYLGVPGALHEVITLEFPLLDAHMLAALLGDGPAASLPAARAATEGEHTALSLVRLTGLLPIAVMQQDIATEDEVSAEAMLSYHENVALEALPDVALPLQGAPECRAVAFREKGGRVHLALIIGAVQQQQAPLARVHSSCVTGDILGSLRCDCGSQLKEAVARMASAGGGVLLYLHQEGRGIGLANKLRAYKLQDGGMDTVDANLALGFAEDERDFTLASEMLKRLGIKAVTLLTNNPAKARALQQHGIDVRATQALAVGANPHNHFYLAAKAAKMGHQF